MKNQNNVFEKLLVTVSAKNPPDNLFWADLTSVYLKNPSRSLSKRILISPSSFGMVPQGRLKRILISETDLSLNYGLARGLSALD